MPLGLIDFEKKAGVNCRTVLSYCLVMKIQLTRLILSH